MTKQKKKRSKTCWRKRKLNEVGRFSQKIYFASQLRTTATYKFLGPCISLLFKQIGHFPSSFLFKKKISWKFHILVLNVFTTVPNKWTCSSGLVRILKSGCWALLVWNKLFPWKFGCYSAHSTHANEATGFTYL